MIQSAIDHPTSFTDSLELPAKRLKAMSVELEQNLERRLEQVARQRSLSVAEFVEAILEQYLDSLAETPTEWVRVTQQRLANSWPLEDFSDWQPPHAS